MNGFSQKVWTVSELNEAVRDLLEGRFDLLWVEGEVADLRRPSSGHVYFSLKDSGGQVRAVLFRSASAAIGFRLEDGMRVLCRGRLSVYPLRGEYQLIVSAAEPYGIGALQRAFEQLKARLETEGLFDGSRKTPIPFLPRRIGVVTSPTGSVLRDILHITARRFPSIPILIAPVRVQGAEAPPEIVRALRDLQAEGLVDVIILARGGGSLEDLAPFNDERVARAIAASTIPVVSAVGHETDYTIADFVADLRAPTPSAAAELVVPVRRDLMTALASLSGRLAKGMDRSISSRSDRIATARQRLGDPARRIVDRRLALDDRLQRLQRLLQDSVAGRRHRLVFTTQQLRHASPRERITGDALHLETLHRDLKRTMEAALLRETQRVRTQAVRLDALNPLAVLRRGYAVARRLPEGALIMDSSALGEGTLVDVRVAEGGFRAAVKETYRS
ncbi:MAG: exodeoxyribonuclease VII large subunit [Deltaproteobacteria bacterium HGW-Deltaproteobacteria-19]|nr:MAG: exodeoxyribonuclease VII large subunit [Deltaproteobacteria bacterium HGW-Deltaproteobacteria-19]